MTVFVDQLLEYPETAIKPAARRYGRQWCHMYSDTSLDELHAFAQKIGMHRAWYQKGLWLTHCHYDLTANMRARAVAVGATEVLSLSHRRELLENGKAWILPDGRTREQAECEHTTAQQTGLYQGKKRSGKFSGKTFECPACQCLVYVPWSHSGPLKGLDAEPLKRKEVQDV